jgi:hypothetical protein
MSDETANARLYSVLSEVCPGVMHGWPLGSAPPLPWFAYRRINGGERYADNHNYALIPRYRIELLMEENDPGLVTEFERALDELGTWKLYSADLIDGESCITYDYRLSLVRRSR